MIFLLAVAIFSYVMLPRLIVSRLADLKEQYGLKEEPTVEVYSSFPPELLMGRIDRIDVQVGQFVQEGVLLRGLYVNLENVDISVRASCKETWSMRSGRLLSWPRCQRIRSTPTCGRITL